MLRRPNYRGRAASVTAPVVNTSLTWVWGWRDGCLRGVGIGREVQSRDSEMLVESTTSRGPPEPALRQHCGRRGCGGTRQVGCARKCCNAAQRKGVWAQARATVLSVVSQLCEKCMLGLRRAGEFDSS